MADNNSELFERNIREINESLYQFNLLLRSTNDLSEDGSDAMEDFIKSLKQADELEKKREQLRKQSLAQSIQSLNSFTNSLLDSSEGLTKYNAGIASAGDAAWSLGKSFGPLGMVAGGLVKVFTFLVGQANRYNEALVKNFNSLSGTGATTTLFTEELKGMAHNVGLTTHNMDILFTNIKDLDIGFLSLGDSVSEGMKNFSEVSKSTKELRAEYAALGLSTEDVIKLNTQLVKTGALSSASSSRNSRDMARAAQGLIKEMVALAELTGVSVDKQMEAVELSRQNEAYAIYQLNKERERDELRTASAAALAKGDREEAKRLELRAQSIDKELKANDELIKSTAKYDQATRAGVLEMITTGGAVSKNTVHLEMLGIQVGKIVEGLRKGESQIYNFDKGMSKGIQDTAKTFDGLAAFAPGLLTEVFGLSPQNAEAIRKTREQMNNLSKEEYEAKIKEIIARDLAAKTGKDAALSAAQTAKEADLASRKTEDALGKLASEVTDGVMKKFFEFIEKVNTKLSELIEGITGYVKKIKGWFGVADDVKDEIEKREKAKLPNQTSAESTRLARAGTQVAAPTSSTVAAPASAGGAGTPPVSPQGTVAGLLDVIGKKESSGNYNILVGGKTADLTGMTIAEVLKFQESMISRGFESTAVGKYQIINKTLKSLIKETGIGLDQKFDQSTQDMLATQLLKRRGLDQYLSKKISPEKFADNLSMEWASLPFNTGKSYYAGVGSNKSGISRDDFLASLPQASNGGIFSGASIGYPITMHGTEMVTPLDANSILAKLAQTSATEIENQLQTQSNTSTEMVSVLIDKLNDMIDRLDNSNDIQSQLLTYARV